MTRIIRDGKSMLRLLCVMTLAVCGPAKAQQPSFAGPYVGLSFGYGQASVKEGSSVWSQAGESDLLANGGEDSRASGATGGLALGYDWRSGNLTVGIDISGAMTKGRAEGTVLTFDSTNSQPADPVGSRTRMKSIAAIKPRLGLVVNDRTRLYGMAGIATARVSRTATGLAGTTTDVFVDPGVSGSSSRWMTGYTMGLGAERRIAGGLSLTLEVNYFDFGSHDFSYGGTTLGLPSNLAQSVKVTYSAATLGLMYRF